MKEFLSVTEFSKLSGIENSTLRYWDEIGLFSPVKRDPDNNYRYYSPMQVITVNFISVLSGVAIPLKVISEMEGQRTPENIIDLIEAQEVQLDVEMRRLRECYSVIHTRRELIKLGLKADPSQITVAKLPEKRLIFGPPAGFRDNEPFYEPFMRFCNTAEEMRINLNYPIGGYQERFDTFVKTPGKPDRFYSLDAAGNARQEAGLYMVGYARGYYGEFGDLPDRMAAYAREKDLKVTGPVYHIYLLDETCIQDPSQYLVRTSVRVLGKGEV